MRPAYLHGRHEPFAVMFHPAAEPHTDIGVIICPPFGWEEMSSYRPRRAWAQALSKQGIATLRIDLPGTGDSGGYPTDEDRLDAWTDSIGESATWLRHETGCRRVVAVCIGVGGLLAYRATADGAPIDDFVFWGTPARGGTFIRETSAFARMEAAQWEKRDELPPDWLAAAGYVLTAQTRAGLETLDVSDMPLHSPAGRHALLLDRDGISVDARLREALERQDVSVQTMLGQGFGKMMVEPQFARTPATVIEQVTAWILALDVAAMPVTPLTDAPPQTSTEVQVFAVDGTPVRESFLTITHPRGTMFGVLTEPLEKRGAIAALFIGGTGHRIGPNRMWVETARRWAALGIPSVRLDVAGTGDAEGVTAPDVPALYTHDFTEQVNAALRALADRGLPQRTIVVGLCAAAHWAMHAALRAEHEVVPFMLNPPTLIWDERGYADRMTRHYLEQLRQASNWKRLLRRELSFAGMRRILLRRLAATLRIDHGHPGGREARVVSGEDVDRALDELRDRRLSALILFTGREVLHEEFQREGRLERLRRWPNLTIEVVPGGPGLHTLRPIWLQRRVHQLLDDGLQRELYHQEEHIGSQ
jgi:pimeloyl-ACP methyl ester carboxylesterase